MRDAPGAGALLEPVQVARRRGDPALGVLLHPETGFFRDLRLDDQGMHNVLSLRSKFTGKTLTDPDKYV